MPLAVAHLDFILLFTIIFITTYLFFAFIYVTGWYIYDKLYCERCWTSKDDKRAMIGPKGFNVRLTPLGGLFDRGHHMLRNQRQHFSDTQNVEKFFIEVLDNSDSDLDVHLVSPFANLAFEGYLICH